MPRRRSLVMQPLKSFSSSRDVPVSTRILRRSFHASSTPRKKRLTHIDSEGNASMVDVSAKEITRRTAMAQGRIYIPKIAYDLVYGSSTDSDTDSKNVQLAYLKEKAKAKGDVFTVAQLAGIMASKRTSDLIPLCHSIPLSHVAVKLILEVHNSKSGETCLERKYSILCSSTVTCDGKTGVEMEALTAVSVSLLTVWDMLKAVGGDLMIIEDICVVKKTGGKNGDFVRHLQNSSSDNSSSHAPANQGSSNNVMA